MKKFYLSFFLLSFFFLGCASFQPIKYYPNFLFQKENITSLTIITDIFIEQSPIVSKPVVDMSTNNRIGKVLVDSLSSMFKRKGYPVTKAYPASIGFGADKIEYDIIGEHQSYYTDDTLSPPFYLPEGFLEDSIVSQGLELFRNHYKARSNVDQIPKDSSYFTKPIHALVAVSAMGYQVSTDKKVANLLVSSLTLGLANPKDSYYGIVMLIIDADSGEQIFKTLTLPGRSNPTIDLFLNTLQTLMSSIPDRVK